METLRFFSPFFLHERVETTEMEEQKITPAEHISHQVAAQTRDAIAGPGIAQTIIAALTFAWTVGFALWRLKEKKREKADRENKRRRDDATTKQHEEQSVALGKRLDKLEKQQKEESEELSLLKERYDQAMVATGEEIAALTSKLDNQKEEASERQDSLKKLHDEEILAKDKENADLRHENAVMLQLLMLEPPPGWAPGGLGET